VAGLICRVDNGGADLYRLVESHPRYLLDSLGEALERNRPQARRGSVFIDADEDRSAVQGEGGDVFGQILVGPVARAQFPFEIQPVAFLQ
jgi:hypothetical protein